MYRGIAFAAMVVVGSLHGTWRQSTVVPVANAERETRIANLPGEVVNNDIAKIAGRAAFQTPSQQPLSKQELFSILLLISQRSHGAQARS